MRNQRLGVTFYLFQFATTCALASTHLMRIAVSWWALEKTGSASIFAEIFAIATAAEVYATPILSSLGDSFNRLYLAAIAQVISTVLALAILWLSMVGEFSAFAVSALLVGGALCSAVRNPASVGLLPSLVRSDQVTAAVGRRSGINSAMLLIAPVVSASVVTFAGISAAIFLACAATLVSCILYLACATKVKLVTTRHSAIAFIRAWPAKTWNGLRALHKTKAEFQLAMVASIVNLVMFPFFSVVVPVWVKLDLNGPAAYIGVFDGIFGVGMILASWGVVGWISKRLGRFGAVFLGFSSLGACVGTLSIVTWFPAAVVISGIMGMSFALININTSAVRAAATPDEFRSRMTAMVSFLANIVNPIGIVIVGFALAAWGVSAVLAAGGVIALAMVPVIAVLHDTRRALNLTDEELVGYYSRVYPNAFR